LAQLRCMGKLTFEGGSKVSSRLLSSSLSLQDTTRSAASQRHGKTFADMAQAVDHYKELLTYVKSAVTRNYSEKSINNMLDFIEKAAEDADAYRCMERFYALTLDTFQSTYQAGAAVARSEGLSPADGEGPRVTQSMSERGRNRRPEQRHVFIGGLLARDPHVCGDEKQQAPQG
jgi:hypothetical protein